MKGKNLIAALLVTVFSVALAIGITFIVARGNAVDLTLLTPLPQSTGQIKSTPITGMPLTDPNMTPTPLPTENCTFPIDVWVQYPAAWKISVYRIGDKTYTKKEMLDTLRGNSTDVRGRLLTQIFVAVLNQQNGADVTTIRTAFAEAISWVQYFPPGSNPSDGDLQKANSIAKTLTSFNEGSLGPQTCAFELAAATVAPLSSQQALQVTGSPTPTKTRQAYIPIQPSETSRPKEYVRPTNPPATRVPPTDIPPTSVPPTDPPEPTPFPTDPPPAPTDPPPPPEPTNPPPVTEPTVVAPPPPPPPAPTAAPTDPPQVTSAATTAPTSKPPKKTPRPAIFFANLFVFTASEH